ncbi:hypothetical protein [Arthrobacter koreensis]|uniref:hypothetical protein n=1 Tax=Arthrobacter koreensis TaxID=199136 RepID=UPI0037FBDDF0
MVIMETIQSWVFLLTLLTLAGLGGKILGDAMLRLDATADAPQEPEPAPSEVPINSEFVQLLKCESSDEPYDQYADLSR